MPSAIQEELAEAIIESVDAGARVINLSSALVRPSPKGEGKLEEALNHASHRGVIGDTSRKGNLRVLAHSRCRIGGNAQAKTNKGCQLEHFHPRLWPALYLKIPESSQSPHHLTDAKFCSVSLAPKVRQNRFWCSATAGKSQQAKGTPAPPLTHKKQQSCRDYH
jgi:hypothetical protein